MRETFLALSVLAAFATSPALADASHPVDLKPVILDDAGVPLKDVSQREPGFVVREAFSFGGKDYKPGDKITDKEEIGRAVAYLSKGNDGYKVASIDPDCSKCAVATVGWILQQALLSRPCSKSDSPQCTPEEKKSEDNPLAAWGRYKEAKTLASESTATFTPSQIAVLKDLVLFRFEANPVIVSQVFPAIDPSAAPADWAK